MADEFEYKVVAGFLVFYAVLFIIVGQVGLVKAEALNYDNINTFSGVKATLDYDIENQGLVSALFTILVTGPLAVIITMIILNYTRGR